MADGADIEVIAPDGDVLLVVGDAKKAKKKLRVSSHTLSSTSPVFKAMFGPHFSEGQQLRGESNAEPVEIPLPEDNPRAMVLVCHLLHGRQSPTEDEKLVNKVDIFEVALIIDKYRVVEMLYWQIRGVLSHWLFDLNEDGYTAFLFVSTVAAAYLLNCDDAYNRATACFINHCEDEITKLVDLPEMINTMPAQVLLILEERRREMHAKLGMPYVSQEVAEDAGLCLRCSREGMQDRYRKCVGAHKARVV